MADNSGIGNHRGGRVGAAKLRLNSWPRGQKSQSRYPLSAQCMLLAWFAKTQHGREANWPPLAPKKALLGACPCGFVSCASAPSRRLSGISGRAVAPFFHALTNYRFRNPFVLKFLQIARAYPKREITLCPSRSTATLGCVLPAGRNDRSRISLLRYFIPSLLYSSETAWAPREEC